MTTFDLFDALSTTRQREVVIWKTETFPMLIILFFMVIQIVTIFYSAFIFPALFLGPHSFCSHFQTQFSIPDVTFSFLRGNLCLFSSSDEKKTRTGEANTKNIYTEESFSAAPVRFLFSLFALFFAPPRAQYDKFKALFAYFPCIINSQFFHNQKPNSSLSLVRPSNPSSSSFHAHTFRCYHA